MRVVAVVVIIVVVVVVVVEVVVVVVAAAAAATSGATRTNEGPELQCWNDGLRWVPTDCLPSLPLTSPHFPSLPSLTRYSSLYLSPRLRFRVFPALILLLVYLEIPRFLCVSAFKERSATSHPFYMITFCVFITTENSLFCIEIFHLFNCNVSTRLLSRSH